MDVLGIAVDVFSAAVVGQSFLKDLKALDRARTMELHPACFIAGTQITVQCEDGEATAKPIEEIEAGDRVLATDAETGATEYKEVVRVFVKESDTLVHLTVNGEEITTTPDHPFRVGDDWIAAGDLREGDLLILADGTTAPLEKIQIETLDAPVTVYNFEVADFHTYYVGNTQILVHNDCKSGSATPDIGTGGNKTSVAGEIDVNKKVVKEYDIVKYKPSNKEFGFENHHGVMDVWAKNNIPGYKSYDKASKSIALTPEMHKATKSEFIRWRIEKTGNPTGQIDWTTVSPQEIQALSERLFDSAFVPQGSRQEYYREFNRYIYGLG